MSALPASLRPLRHRPFALVMAGAMVSNAGSWMASVSVASLVRAETGSDALTAVAALAAFLPIGLVTPIGGALADRLDRRRSIITMCLAETAVAATLAALAFADAARPGLVIALVGIEGCFAAVRFPFQQAVLPDLVPAEDLLPAAALGAAQYNVGRVVGPALAAIVIASAGFGAAFAVNAVSFLFVAAVALPLRLPAPRGEHGSLLRGIRDGARLSWSVPAVRTATLSLAAVAVLLAPFIALVASRAAQLVDGDARDVARATGILTTAQGLGAVASALVMPSVAEAIGRSRVIVGCTLASCAAVAAYALVPDLPSAGAAMVVLGAGYTGVLTGLQTVVQLAAPIELRGRVLSMFFLALGVLYPVGAVVHGAIADRTSLAVPVVASAGALAAALALIVTVRPHTLRVLDTP